MVAIRETLKGLVRGTVLSRNRDDLRPGLQMVVSGRHCIFFEEDGEPDE
jgi:plasmid stabilization system protein ParE